MLNWLVVLEAITQNTLVELDVATAEDCALVGLILNDFDEGDIVDTSVSTEVDKIVEGRRGVDDCVFVDMNSEELTSIEKLEADELRRTELLEGELTTVENAVEGRSEIDMLKEDPMRGSKELDV